MELEKRTRIGWPRIALAASTVALMVWALSIKSSLVVFLVLEAAIFIPVERVLELRPQRVFRKYWHSDVIHSFVNATLTNALLFSLIGAAYGAGRFFLPDSLFAAVASQPMWLQFVEAVLLAELGSYAAHRFCHENRFMWKFHALHHSVEEMDWIAAARVHPVDQIFTRSIVLIPVTVLFPADTLAVYLVISGFQSFFIHSNIRTTFGPLRWLVATPEFHHWHHANQKKAYNTNYSQQFPWMDAIFGTLHMPKGERPDKFGIDDQPPVNYVEQVAWSFTYRPGKAARKAREAAARAAAEEQADAPAPEARPDHTSRRAS